MDRFARWVERYRVAWETNDPEDISALFTDAAVYLTGPGDEPWEGRDAIVEGWLDAKDEPGDTAFTFEPVAVAGDTAFVRGVSVYRTSGKTYDNLWEVTLDGTDRCSRFVEWWMERKA